MTIVENWSVLHINGAERLLGRLSGPGYGPHDDIITTAIQSIDFQGRRVFTRNSTYNLGTPDPEFVLQARSTNPTYCAGLTEYFPEA
jgi:hypothetical protein